MLIKIHRSGGFAGIDEDLGFIDTTTLDAAVAEKVEQWLADLGQQNQEPDGADMYLYQIAISDDSDNDQVLEIGGGGDPGTPAPDPLRELCELAAGT